jgi:type III secretory pathway component EscR
MYSLWRNEPLREQIKSNARTIVTSQVLSLLPALLITELFFHWKSFLLEFVGFLATWFVIDFVLSKLLALIRPLRRKSVS